MLKLERRRIISGTRPSRRQLKIPLCVSKRSLAAIQQDEFLIQFENASKKNKKYKKYFGFFRGWIVSKVLQTSANRIVSILFVSKWKKKPWETPEKRKLISLPKKPSKIVRTLNGIQIFGTFKSESDQSQNIKMREFSSTQRGCL